MFHIVYFIGIISTVAGIGVFSIYSNLLEPNFAGVLLFAFLFATVFGVTTSLSHLYFGLFEYIFEHLKIKHKKIMKKKVHIIILNGFQMMHVVAVLVLANYTKIGTAILIVFFGVAIKRYMNGIYEIGETDEK